MANPRWAMLTVILAWAWLSGCSRDLGTVTFYGPGLTETRFDLEGPATIAFVTNLEVEGPPELEPAAGDYRYDIEAWQQNRVVAQTRCDPLGLGRSWARSRRESNTRIGAYRHSVTEARLVGCSLELARGGATAVRVRLVQVRSSKVQLLDLHVIAREGKAE